MTLAVVAEKPAVARDIAQVLGARAREEGCLRGGGYVVTWAIGHLVALAEPHELDPRWKEWRMAELPILPDDWRLVVAASTSDQFANVRRVLLAPDVTGVICATDAGREGELIFRYIYEAARCKKPVRRLWISSLTPDAIAKGFRDLRDGKRVRRARPRRARPQPRRLARRDEPVAGLQPRRATRCSRSGRVQTPTLAMLVAREQEIRSFVPEDYLEVVATFAVQATREDAVAAPTPAPGFRANRGDLPKDGDRRRRSSRACARGHAQIESVEREVRSVPPPLLYDLTELQRHANRLYGMSAQRTLDVAQALYERRKLLSYPRTDSRQLSHAVADTLPDVIRAIAEPYRARLAPGTGARPLGPRFVDDARVTDHHAIIPTTTRAPADLAGDERASTTWSAGGCSRRGTTTTSTRPPRWSRRVTSSEVDRFASSGTSIERLGWKVLDVGEGKSKGDAPSAAGGPRAKAVPVDVTDAKAVEKQTRPPPRFTDATLLTAMETAGRGLPEKEIAEAMRECGLGTPATRAAIIETLLKREYAVREGKSLQATDKGIALVEVVHPNVKSPAMTGEWEAQLARIERGTADFDAFMGGIEGYVRDVVESVRGAARSPVPPASATDASGAVASSAPRRERPAPPRGACDASACARRSASPRSAPTRKRSAARRRSGATCSS